MIKVFFDNYANDDNVLEEYFFTKRRRVDLEKVNDNFQGF